MKKTTASNRMKAQRSALLQSALAARPTIAERLAARLAASAVVCVLAPYAKSKMPFENDGRRVVVGQRIIQGAPDIFLGWCKVGGVDFYIRQLRDMKGSAEFVPGETKMSNFIEYCGLCGWALALAHAKSGDPAMIAGYCGKNDELDGAMAAFAHAYADQTERDYATLVKAAKSGRLSVAKEF